MTAEKVFEELDAHPKSLQGHSKADTASRVSTNDMTITFENTGGKRLINIKTLIILPEKLATVKVPKQSI